MTNDSIIVEAVNVSMVYKTFKSRRSSLRESVFRTLLHRDSRVTINALRDVNLTLKKGDSLGVIGRNGAGKSTLCLLLSGIMDPTSGHLRVEGRVSALLTLGAGFQNDLTGRDNILLNGVLLGHRLDEIQEKTASIIEFAELEEHVDLPVRTYSAGMRARLAFSIAASIQPEILVIDELLGVGDLAFREKSTRRMHELVEQSQALVVVSHNLNTVRSLCTRAVWLRDGQIVADGPADDVASQYEAHEMPAVAVGNY